MRTLCAALLLAACHAFAGDLVAKDGKNSVRLTQEPCPVSVLKLIPEGSRGPFRKATAIIEGQSYLACHALREDGLVMLVYEDSDRGLMPVSMFREDLGVG